MIEENTVSMGQALVLHAPLESTLIFKVQQFALIAPRVNLIATQEPHPVRFARWIRHLNRAPRSVLDALKESMGR